MCRLSRLPDNFARRFCPLLFCSLLALAAGCGESDSSDSAAAPAGTTVPDNSTAAVSAQADESGDAAADGVNAAGELATGDVGSEATVGDSTGGNPPSADNNQPAQTTTATPEQQATATPEQQATAALHDAIARLEKKDYAGFIKYYVPYEDVQRMRERGGSRAMILAFVGNPELPTRVLTALRNVKDASPTMDTNRGLATFTAELPESESTRQKSEDDQAGGITTSDDIGYQLPLKETLAEAVKALDNDDVLGFIRKFYPSDELTRISSASSGEATPQEHLLARIKARPEMIVQMKADLSRMQELEPEMQDSGNLAIYTIPGETVTTERVSYQLPDRTFRLAKDGPSWKIAPAKPELREKFAELKNLEASPLSVTIVFEQIGDAWRMLSLQDL